MLRHLSNHGHGPCTVRRENVETSEACKNLFHRVQGCRFTGVRQTYWLAANLAPQFMPCTFSAQLTLRIVGRRKQRSECRFWPLHIPLQELVGSVFTEPERFIVLDLGAAAHLAYNLFCGYMLLHVTATNLDRRFCQSRGSLRLE